MELGELGADMQANDGLVLTLLRELDEITATDRVRQATDLRVQDRMDAELIARVGKWVDAPEHLIAARLTALDREWAVERVLVLQSSITSLLGLALARTSGRRWVLLTAATAGFLLQHAVQGWCPPLSLHRRLGFRTQREIDLEIHVLKHLRGDYARLTAASEP